MKRMRYPRLAVLLVLALSAMLLAACTPATERGYAYEWYVATDGNDANNCYDPSTPCLTLQGAFNRAKETSTSVAADYPGEAVRFEHTVHVAAGTYMTEAPAAGASFARADFDVRVVGAGEESTIFDSGNVYSGLLVRDDAQVRLSDFTLRNVAGNAPHSCVNIQGSAEVEMENVTLDHCQSSGIAHFSSGQLTLTNVTSTNNLLDSGGNGSGLSTGGNVTIEGGSFSNNQGSGISVVSSGEVVANETIVESNGGDGVTVRDAGVTLSGMQINDNGAASEFRAGLVTIGEAHATVSNSQFNDNDFGIWVQDGNVRVTGSEISGNPRSGVQVDGGEVRLTDSAVTDNGSFYADTDLGGGIRIASDARAILRGSQVSDNHSGGIENSGVLFLTESAITDNVGNAPALLNESGASAILERSLIANNDTGGNVSEGGVAVANRGYLNLTNSTVSGNEGSGLVNSSELVIVYSTLAFNTGYGFLSSESSLATPNVANSLVAGNGTDCYIPGAATGVPTLRGNNMDSDGSCGFPETYAMADLHLDALADNGGLTMTHALLDDSPAIDDAGAECPAEDQRNVARPFGPGCDLGAFETGGTALSLETDLELAIDVPAGGQPTLVITTEAGCFFGPGEAWLMVNRLPAGTQADIVGQGWGGGWMVIKHPDKDINCWVEQDKTQFDIPLDQLRFIAVPEKPTPTPSVKEERDTATPDCYYDFNNNLICQ